LETRRDRGLGNGHGLVDLLPGALRDAHPAAALALDPDARGVARLRVEQHHVRDVDRALALDHAALGGLGPLRVAQHHRALGALLDVEALDEDLLLAKVDAQHLAGLALVLAGDDLDEVVAADLRAVRHQRTSGARETIFMKLRSRSSRATGPKMRVPRGLFCG